MIMDIIVNQFGLPTRASSNSILGKATGLHFRDYLTLLNIKA
jgi:hypothetical protein